MSDPIQTGPAPRPRRDRSKQSPPLWLMAVLALCLVLILIFALSRKGPGGQAAEVTPIPTASAAPSPTPAPTPEPTPTPTPEPDWSQPVPKGEKVEMDWFSDAVFIGDSRTDGFKLYSGVEGADFLDYTGITVYDVMDGKEVIRSGEKKISILDALAQKTYGKVYISLGVNELGYNDSADFAETYGRFLDAVAERQPDAAVYVQALIPVNTAKCQANDQPYYVTNEAISSYNEALAGLTAEKKVYFLAVPETLLDENGEVQRELSTDGVHFRKDGYVLWLADLMTHTGT